MPDMCICIVVSAAVLLSSSIASSSQLHHLRIIHIDQSGLCLVMYFTHQKHNNRKCVAFVFFNIPLDINRHIPQPQPYNFTIQHHVVADIYQYCPFPFLAENGTFITLLNYNQLQKYMVGTYTYTTMFSSPYYNIFFLWFYL